MSVECCRHEGNSAGWLGAGSSCPVRPTILFTDRGVNTLQLFLSHRSLKSSDAGEGASTGAQRMSAFTSASMACSTVSSLETVMILSGLANFSSVWRDKKSRASRAMPRVGIESTWRTDVGCCGKWLSGAGRKSEEEMRVRGRSNDGDGQPNLTSGESDTSKWKAIGRKEEGKRKKRSLGGDAREEKIGGEMVVARGERANVTRRRVMRERWR